MANLFDTIQQNNQQAAVDATSGPKDASEQNVTGQVQTLLRAKSGKAVGAGGVPRASNIQEQQANATGAAQGQELAQKVAATNTELATNVQQQQQAVTQQKEERTFQASKLETDYLRDEDAIINQYVQGQKKLDIQKDKAKMEQIGFKLRLADQQYIDTLNREGKRARLDNDVAFRNEMARTTFSDELDMFHDNLDFRASIFADKQEFNERMANMDLDYAMAMAKENINAASQQAIWTGVGQVVQGGTKAYAASADADSEAQLKENKANAKSGSAWGTSSATPTSNTTSSSPGAGVGFKNDTGGLEG